MRWTETAWFKKLCLVMVCIFFSQSVQPMAFGFARPRAMANSLKSQSTTTGTFKSRLVNQVNGLFDTVNKKLKMQLKGMKVLSDVQELPSKYTDEMVSCAAPEAGQLASTKNLDSHSSLQPPSMRTSRFAQTVFPAREKEKVNEEKRRKIEKGGGNWLNWLSNLLVSEAHAQTPPDPNLSSTPDANATDQFIIDKTQELNNDVGAIFAFVRDEIGYESYKGSLRGSRGALWSNAGNALDQTSLLIALLRASGVPARYAQGTLSDPLARELILSMFPNPTSVVGCPPDNVERADPANDPQLLTETREHYWVEADLGGGFVPLDPTFGNAQLDQAFATADSTFTEVPDSIRHKVTVRLKAELTDGFTGGLQHPKTVLDQTFNTVELVGHPLSVGHFVNTVQSGGLVFTTTTHTYSPYILVGENDSDISDDELMRGVDYEETLSNFPLSSQFLTGVFLEMDVIEPEDENGQRAIQVHQRDIFDRIGFAARQAGGTTSLGGVTDGNPSLTPFDVATINVLSGLQLPETVDNLEERLPFLQNRQTEIQPLFEALPADEPLTAEQRAIVGKAVSLARDISLVTAETLTMAHASASDLALSRLEQGFMSRAYYVSPRLILALTQRQNQQVSTQLDLRKNDLRVILSAGQVTKIRSNDVISLPIDQEVDLSFVFELTRGIIESILEAKVLSAVTGQEVISIADIFSNLSETEDLTFVVQDNLQDLESLNISDLAKARITQSVLLGKGITTPTRMVSVQGESTIQWLETDLETGQTISVTEDGGHAVGVEYGTIVDNPAAAAALGLVGTIAGFIVPNLFFVTNYAGLRKNGLEDKAAFDKALNSAADMYAKVLEGLTLFIISDGGFLLAGPLAFFAGFVVGGVSGLTFVFLTQMKDPRIFPFLSSDLIVGPSPITPGPIPRVALQVVPDDFFTIPVSGAEVPSVFRAQIQNLGPEEDTFALNFSQVPQGFTIQSSVSELTVPAGVTGEIGICVIPDGALGTAGDPAAFTADVVSTTDPTVTATDAEPFTIPAVPGMTLEGSPALLSSTPGAAVSSTLTIASVGNATLTDVPLTLETSSDLTVSGLTSPITLNAGQSATQALTFTPAAGAAVNSTLTATVTATLPVAPFTVSTPISVQVLAPEALPAAQGAICAASLNQAELATTLDSLSSTITSLFGDLDDEAYKSRLLATLDTLIGQVASDVNFNGLATNLIADRTAIAAASDQSTLQTALGSLSSTLTQFQALCGDVATHDIGISLTPNQVFAAPTTGGNFDIVLQARGNQQTEVTLAANGLPPEVAVTFGSNPVMLNPGDTQVVPLTLQSSQAGNFSFSINAQLTGVTQLQPSVHGTLVSASSAVNVVSVVSTPAFILPDAITTIQALVANTANIPLTGQATVTVRRQNGTIQFTSPAPIPISLPTSVDPVLFNLDLITATGWPEDFYTVEVQVTDGSSQALPGGQGTGTLTVGQILDATIAGSPTIVPPGDHVVNVDLAVRRQQSVGGELSGIIPTDPSLDRVNFAAASQGATISEAAFLIDEQGSELSPSSSTFWTVEEPINLDLSVPRVFDTIQLRLWDGDTRFYQYRIEASADGTNFTTIVDKTTGEHRSRQIDHFEPVTARYLKIIGTFNSHRPFGSQDSTFHLIDEFLVNGDATGTPVPTQSVTIDGAANGGPDHTNGQVLSLNAGLYEVSYIGGSISKFPDDTGNAGRSWEVDIGVTVPVANKVYRLGFTHETISRFATAIEAEQAAAGKSFTIYLPVHADVYFWNLDTVPADNRGTQQVQVRQLSGANDSLLARVQDAMMRSVLFEQPAVAHWQSWLTTPTSHCFGCHTQAQASTGLAISKRKVPTLPIDSRLQDKFVEAYRFWQRWDGLVSRFDAGHPISTTSMWTWAVSHLSLDFENQLATPLLRALDWLLGQRQANGGWNADFTSQDASDVFHDGFPSATHTAGNMEALARGLEIIEGKDFIPFDGVTVNTHEIITLENVGKTMEIRFPPQQNVTGVKVLITDTFSPNNNFVINELEAFEGGDPRSIVSAQASVQQAFFPISESFNGIKTNINDGWAVNSNIPAEGVWVFDQATTIDRIRITQIFPDHQLEHVFLLFTTDSSPTLASNFQPIPISMIGLPVDNREQDYRDALQQAAALLAGSGWDFARNTRTAAQTVFGLDAALPYLDAGDADAALARRAEVDIHLRTIQNADGGWGTGAGTASITFQTAQALEALLRQVESSVDSAILNGADFLLNRQRADGSWGAPQLKTALASTSWVQIALPTIFENFASITLNVEHRLPTGGGVTFVDGSAVPALTSSTGGTLVWDALLDQNDTQQDFAAQVQVQGLQPGEVRQISEGSTVQFSSVEGNGTFELPPLFLSAKRLVSLTPSAQQVRPGETAAFTVTVENLLTTSETFSLAVQGVPVEDVDLADSIALAGGETGSLPLTITIPSNHALTDVDFTVVAQGGGLTDSVSGSVSVQGEPVVPVLDTSARGVSLLLTPGTSQTGQGTSAMAVVRVTNTGNVAETFTLTGSFPAGVIGTFAQSSIDVPAGLTNFREVVVILTSAAGTTLGDLPFTVTATSTAAAAVQDTQTGTVSVVNLGVGVTLSPTTGTPATLFTMTVTNTGQVAETFDLALGGPLAAFGLLGSATVTLNPGASQAVPISLSMDEVAFPGELTLFAIATSQTNAAVQASATATVTIPIKEGLTAAFDPTERILTAPEDASFLLIVQNTGNQEEAYSAEITGTTGPITASLAGLDAQPTQLIPTFRLPGHATGALSLNTTLSDIGEGTVTVTVTSQGENGQVRNVASIARVEVPNQPPVANAGPDLSLTLGQTATVDGSASNDPDEFPSALTFQWTLVSVPTNSALTDGDIVNATDPLASITPDVLGDFVLRLTVSDGNESAIDETVIRVENRVPIAHAGPNQHVETGTQATLDGSGSFDLDGQLLTYQWSLLTVPVGSTRTAADIQGATTPRPIFVPDVEGNYVFQLVVNDGVVDSAADEMTVVASGPNVPPNANAGDDQAAFVGGTVSLDGTRSQDPDNGPNPLTFLWSFVQVPVGSLLTDLNIVDFGLAQASFVPDVAGDYVLALEVSDGLTNDVAEITITALASEVPPNANAGADQTVPLGPVVLLDGTGSQDPDNGPSPLALTWQFVAVPALSALTNANLLDAETATPRFTPDIEGVYVLELVVSDGGQTDRDAVMITVGLPLIQLIGQIDVNSVAFIGQEVPVQVTVTNEGTGVVDPATVEIQIIELATGALIVQVMETTVLPPGQPVISNQVIPGTLALGEYLVVVRVGTGTSQQTVATASLTITPPPDTDGDGIDDTQDSCLNSNLEATVVIDGCNSGAINQLLSNGCTFSDDIAECATSVSTHGDFVSCVSALTNNWKSQGLITGKEKGKIESCAARSDIP